MTIVNQSTPTFPVHDVPITRPFIWLGRGWSDIRSNPAPSLAYGWLVASMGALVLAYLRGRYHSRLFVCGVSDHRRCM